MKSQLRHLATQDSKSTNEACRSISLQVKAFRDVILRGRTLLCIADQVGLRLPTGDELELWGNRLESKQPAEAFSSLRFDMRWLYILKTPAALVIRQVGEYVDTK